MFFEVIKFDFTVYELKKYGWQKPHLSNQTGTENSYHPNKKNYDIDKKYRSWKK